ncbi:hypothetical protein [Sphingosinicella sp. BN140058]|nr:hypothetical protein [Sphingosinicella sp. BN140058]
MERILRRLGLSDSHRHRVAAWAQRMDWGFLGAAAALLLGILLALHYLR